MIDPNPNKSTEHEKSDRFDTYSAQRDELLTLLQTCRAKHEPLTVYDKPVLSPDDVSLILHKIRHSIHFSRRERQSMTEAGFQLDKLYPKL